MRSLSERGEASGEAGTSKASATGPGGGVDITKKLRPGLIDEYERQPLSETQGVCDSVGESGESSEPEWVIHYDRTGRPYWSDGVTSTWKKPHSYRPV